MTSLDGRPNTALHVIDVQCGVLDQSVDHDGVAGRIAELVDCAAANHDGAKYADPERFDLDRFPLCLQGRGWRWASTSPSSRWGVLG